MAAEYLSLTELDSLIKSGWGDTPGYIIELIRERHNGELPKYHWLHVQRVRNEMVAQKQKEKRQDAVGDRYPARRRDLHH